MNIQKILHSTYKVCRRGFLAAATIHMLQIHTKIINDTVSKCYAIYIEKAQGQKRGVHNFGNITPISFPVSNMPVVNIFCKFSFFVMIWSPSSSLYEKQKFIKTAFLRETKKIVETSIKYIYSRVNKYAEHYYKDECYCNLHQQTWKYFKKVLQGKKTKVGQISTLHPKGYRWFLIILKHSGAYSSFFNGNEIC